MAVQGKIKVIGELETFASGFTKKLLVVTTEEQYPQIIAIEFLKDKIDLLNGYAVGQDVKVSINLGGREWMNPQGEAKYFNSVTGWRVEKAEAAAEPFTPPTVLETEDDLPF
jgi:hypothetical protein